MNCTVNGDAMTFDRLMKLDELLVELTMDSRPCAVEVNRELVPRASHQDHQLVDGDIIEIVTLVGGG
ncbi:MAG: sulfur carrier protein ThiS [Planctomycetota bacterium]|nr:sulfur carrier protein ThiS [Planctomycetota bacterium]